MSSATSTDGSSFRPWHFFVLAGLLAATAAVFLGRGSSPAQIALVTLAIWSAGLAGLALHRTLVPLADPEREGPPVVGDRTREALESEKALVLRSIKELQFDRAMGKIAAADFDEMVGRLRARAIGLLAQLDAEDGGGGYRDLIARELRARVASAEAERLVEVGAEVETDSDDPVASPGDDVERDRPTAEQETPTRETVVAPATTACPVCETENDADARFCKRCGQPLETEADVDA